MILLYLFFFFFLLYYSLYLSQDYHKCYETKCDFGNPTWYPIGLLFCSIQPIISTGIVSSVRDTTVVSSDAQMPCVCFDSDWTSTHSAIVFTERFRFFCFRLFLFFLRFSYQALTKTDVREAVWDLRTIPGWFCRCRTNRDS